jgi:hypothetical protein
MVVMFMYVSNKKKKNIKSTCVPTHVAEGCTCFVCNLEKCCLELKTMGRGRNFRNKEKKFAQKRRAKEVC